MVPGALPGSGSVPVLVAQDCWNKKTIFFFALALALVNGSQVIVYQVYRYLLL
jgi:hypothetical protein